MRTVPLLIALAASGCGAKDAAAGAWLRERGSLFASASARLSWPQDITTWTSLEPTGQYYTFYAEYGLTERLTVGMDLGRSVSGDGKGVAFLRLPLRDRDSGLKIATELGLGQIDGTPVLRPGLSLGLGLRHGWLSADGLAEDAPLSGQVDLKLDLTWGWNLPGDRHLILQVQTGAPHGDAPFARLAPSVVVPVTERLSAEVGATWGVTGDASMGVLVGLWAEF